MTPLSFPMISTKLEQDSYNYSQTINTMWFYILLSSVQVFSSSSQIIRNTVSGEYHVDFKEFSPCSPDNRGTNELFTDVHLTRRHRKAEIIGNISNAIPFDDTVSLKVNFAVLGSNAAWIPNFINMTFLKGCSDGFENIFKEGWVNFMKSFNISPACPVPKGFYQTKGFDADEFIKYSVLPKRFIYGRYKMILSYYNKQNKHVGCVYTIIDLVPVWQNKKRT